MTPLWGGIEAGGTKFVCAVGSGPDDLRAEARFLTTTPEETIGRAIRFFQQHQGLGRRPSPNGRRLSPNGRGLSPNGRRPSPNLEPLTAIGIASFGPVDPNPASPTFGHITTTPKPGWAYTDLAGAVQRALGVAVGFDTDVNAAALGEHRWGAAQGLDTFVYLTIGTGIGGGGMVNGQLIHGLIHPEMGHMLIPHDWDSDPYAGSCPYHGDCLEGLATGPALEGRWGQRGEMLPADHPAWPLEAKYLALGLVNIICILSPQRIIMGGGVMQQPVLFPLVRREVQELLHGYLRAPAILEQIDDYIVPPGLGDRAGVLGAIALAQQV